MIDFPLNALMDNAACAAWLEQHLRPAGLLCPLCGTYKGR